MVKLGGGLKRELRSNPCRGLVAPPNSTRMPNLALDALQVPEKEGGFCFPTVVGGGTEYLTVICCSVDLLLPGRET